MKVECKKLDHLFEKHPNDIHCRLYSPVIAAGKKYKAGSECTHRDIGIFIRAGIVEVDLFFDVTLYEYLSHEFPFEFRRPLRWLDYYTIDQHLEDLDRANGQSQRKRFLILVGDVYQRGAQPAVPHVVFRHGDRLDYNKWKINKIHVASSQKFFVRSSEHGIILFGELKSEDYVDESGFRKRLNLVDAMRSQNALPSFEVSPDFIPEQDVHTVTLPGRLAETYISTGSRLIVIGETLTAAHKEALLQVKRYDPFVRMMVTPPLDPQTIDHLLLQIKMMYHNDLWKKNEHPSADAEHAKGCFDIPAGRAHLKALYR